MLVATRSCRRKRTDSFQEPPEAVWPYRHLDLGLLSSRIRFCPVSPVVCGDRYSSHMMLNTQPGQVSWGCLAVGAQHSPPFAIVELYITGCKPRESCNLTGLVHFCISSAWLCLACSGWLSNICWMNEFSQNPGPHNPLTSLYCLWGQCGWNKPHELFQRERSPARAGAGGQCWMDSEQLTRCDLLISSHTSRPQLHSHLEVTRGSASSRQPQAHLQPGVQGPLGGTCGFLLGWRAVGNIHNYFWGSIDAEGRAALRGRAVGERDGETEGHPEAGPAHHCSPQHPSFSQQVSTPDGGQSDADRGSEYCEAVRK